MVNKIINYLLNTYTLKLKFGGGNKLKIAINTSFMDNINNQKSLQGYTIHLFKGLITEKINKQNTVTISIIKAELLNLLQL